MLEQEISSHADTQQYDHYIFCGLDASLYTIGIFFCELIEPLIEFHEELVYTLHILGRRRRLEQQSTQRRRERQGYERRDDN